MTSVLAICIALLYCISTDAICDSIGPGSVPENLRSFVDSLYPDASQIKWEKENDLWEAEICEENGEVSILLDEMGSVIETETEIVPDALPRAVEESIKVHYPDTIIKEAEHVKSPEKEWYVVEVSDGFEILIDSVGNIFSEDDKTDDDTEESEDSHD